MDFGRQAEGSPARAGTYTFHEEAAPSGYEAVTDFNFTASRTAQSRLRTLK